MVDFVHKFLRDLLVFYLEEELSGCVIASKVRTEMERCVVQGVPCVWLSPEVEEQLNEWHFTCDASEVERRDACFWARDVQVCEFSDG